VDLTKCGVYAYVDSPNFTVSLFAYAFDDEETKIVDLACGEQLPRKVLDALTDERVIKTAFNAMFERTCLSRYLGIPLSPVSWQCTAVSRRCLPCRFH
jgi:DNA polymerase bacteriophage-type